MRGHPVCPRCATVLQAPGLWSSEWRCDLHGAVAPRQPLRSPSLEACADVAARATVPMWLPWPLPRGWLCTGFACAGDSRSGARGLAVAMTGPAPLGGLGELVVIAEEPGVGLGAAYAGMPELDPGDVCDGAPHVKLDAAGQRTSLWAVPSPPDRAVYVGEGLGSWLWLVLWPEPTAALLLEDLALVDLRGFGAELALVPFGAQSPRLDTPPWLPATVAAGPSEPIGSPSQP